MPYLYAISDPHGRLDVFGVALESVDLSDPESHLYLLGDYVPHEESCAGDADFRRRREEALRFTKGFCDTHAEQVTALRGNHEQFVLDDLASGTLELDRDLAGWVRGLPLFAEAAGGGPVFVHAGVDEEAGEWWKAGTAEETFTGKFPATFGEFARDVVAGHVGTADISGDPGFHGACWDGQSHYYIDGTTETSGVVPVLRYDTGKRAYACWTVTAAGAGPLETPLLVEGAGSSHDDDWW